MAENTKIEWAHHTFNPWIGCTKVSPACDHCYAEKERASTVLGVKWGANMPRHRTSDENWKKPGRWNKEAERLGVRYRVFCASLADVFDNEVPQLWRTWLFGLIHDTPRLDWLLLTKRIGNAAKMLMEDAPEGIDMATLPNIWIGASITSQAEADRDIPKLLAVPAAKRFLSMEPLLGPVDLTKVAVGGGHGHHEFDPIITGNALRRAYSIDPSIAWVIVGGESGPNARPMHPDWARDLRNQCQTAGVPFLFKQWGEWCPRGPESLGYPSVDGVPRLRMTDAGHNGQDLGADGGNDVWMNRAGKKAAGRLLDGRTWDEVPS
jgi:protein gp37